MSAHFFRPVLVNSMTASVILGVRPVELPPLVECGRLLWVWNVGAGQNAHYRFWLGEVMRPGPEVRRLAVERVIAAVLGPLGRWIPRPRVEELLLLDKASIYDLNRAGWLPIRGSHAVERSALEEFLRERWVGTLPKVNRTEANEGNEVGRYSGLVYA
jgi:hypothetical protein